MALDLRASPLYWWHPAARNPRKTRGGRMPPIQTEWHWADALPLAGCYDELRL